MKLRKLADEILIGESPPTRGRGLKHIGNGGIHNLIKSPPTRGRGLKRSRKATPADEDSRPPRGGVD